MTDARTPSPRRSGLPPWVRVFVPAVILVAEIALLKLCFKTDILEGEDLWWASSLRALRFNTPLGLCALAGILLLGRQRIVEAFRDEGSATSANRRPWIPALVHAAGLVILIALTARMLRPDVAQAPLAAWLPLPWLAAAAVALLGAVSLSIPIGAVARVAKRLVWVFLGGTALGVAAFGVGSAVNAAWPFADPLTRGTLWMSDRLLGLVLEERIYEPGEMVLGTETFPVHVTRFCSGYEGISLFLVFFCLFLVLWRERLRFPRALLLLPVGMLAAWILNAGRIAALVLVGTYVSPEFAVEGFHVYAGWPLLCGVALGCVALGTRLPTFAASPATERGGVNPTAVYLGPLLVWTACGLVAGAITRHPEDLYLLRAAPVVLLLWLRRREVRDFGGRGSLAAVGFGVAAFLAWVGCILLFERSAAVPDPGRVLPGSGATSVLAWSVRAVGMCTLTPVMEELAFRGYLARRAVDADFERVDPRLLGWIPFLVSSIAFGLLHPKALAGFGAGAVFFVAYRRSGRLVDAVIAHGITNVLVTLLTLATGDARYFG